MRPGGMGSVMPCSPQAAYLQRAGVRTAVLEKRHVLGGAAVTEEIVPGTPACPLAPHPRPAWAWVDPTAMCLPGFKFSRASYLLSLLRPQIYAELELQVPAPIPRRAAGTPGMLAG